MNTLAADRALYALGYLRGMWERNGVVQKSIDAAEAAALKAIPDDTNDIANTQFPECSECGAPVGQAHDPLCPLPVPPS